MAEPALAARRLVIRGRVQGVGFRPFVYRLAHRLGLCGFVRNERGTVIVLVQGAAYRLDAFERALRREAPPLARPCIASVTRCAPTDLHAFEIRGSAATGDGAPVVPPDCFACDECLAEVAAPGDRRFGYPFANCTQCGPRYTIMAETPYDRARTSLRDFPLCTACAAEFADPLDRRFHAQPLACPDCGPRLCFRRGSEQIDGTRAALDACLGELRRGAIVAVKGVGGYHLLCDARDAGAVAALRARKHRPHKPLAVLFPARGPDGLAAVREAAEVDGAAARALCDPARPIVLVQRRAGGLLCPGVAPGLAEIGALIPYSPLHALLADAFAAPLVATSANRSGEPVLTDAAEVEARLGDVADAFLHHDRPILRPADDSLVRVIAGAARPLRLGRGLAPLELRAPRALDEPVLALGGHMKAAVALGWQDRIVVSPHIGDLDAPRSLDVFEQVVRDLARLYRVQVGRLLCDRHPGYASTRFALRAPIPHTLVYHHHAHASALAGEHPDVRRWLVFTWDGVGLGPDGTLWGGEALCGAPGAWQRVASLRPFRLPGGDRASREPWRSAAALEWELGLEGTQRAERELARAAWQRGLHSHATSAVGRLFDAAAFWILGLEAATFEAQGPQQLEALADPRAEPVAVEHARDADGVLRWDWSPLVSVLRARERSPAERAGILHATLAEVIAEQVCHIRMSNDLDAVGLAGGVFQNRRLSERVVERLGASGVAVRLAERVPAGDGGLCYGQIVEWQGRARG
jgi:hydrogenase maturation protein HypF